MVFDSGFPLKQICISETQSNCNLGPHIGYAACLSIEYKVCGHYTQTIGLFLTVGIQFDQPCASIIRTYILIQGHLIFR